MHLYLHVPFCARRCSYCDFAIAVRRETPTAAFADAVAAEWRQAVGSGRWDSAAPLATVYFGGGTPSRLDPGGIATILETIDRDRRISPGAEITIEANPEDVSPAATRAWRSAGINRVSLGVQSFDPAVLAWMHRTHTAEQVPLAMALLRDAGFTNLSLDLIYALPAALQRDWGRDLDAALGLAPEHLSLYGLSVEPATPLGRWVERGDAAPVPDERYAAEFLEADARLATAGYRHYEVSNYAQAGAMAVHNSAYWKRAPYLGLGPSAHSGLGASRWWNIREYEAWRAAVAAGRSTVAGEETLGADAITLEDLYLGLRTDAGVPYSSVESALGESWVSAGWAEAAGGRLRLRAEGWLRLDALVAQAGARIGASGGAC